VRSIPQQGDVHEVAWSSAGRPVVRPASDAVFAAAAARPAPKVEVATEETITQESLPTSFDSP
jgi:hypothetical protein